MTDDKPNPIRFLEGKRFGEKGGADPREAQAKSVEPTKRTNSVRKEVAKIAAHEFDTAEGADPLPVQIRRDIYGGKKMTGAQILAATRFAQGIKNFKAMQNIVEDCDGKLKEVKEVRANIGYAELVSGSIEKELTDETLVTGLAEGDS